MKIYILNRIIKSKDHLMKESLSYDINFQLDSCLKKDFKFNPSVTMSTKHDPQELIGT